MKPRLIDRLADNVARQLVRKGWTSNDLVARGLSPLTVERLLNEQSRARLRLRVGLEWIEKLADALEVDPALLFQKRDHESDEPLPDSKLDRLRWSGRLVMMGEQLHPEAGAAFLAVTHTGSLRNAGRIMIPPRSKNGVFLALRTLERAFDQPLFSHSVRGSTLTPLGEEVCERIRWLQRHGE